MRERSSMIAILCMYIYFAYYGLVDYNDYNAQVGLRWLHRARVLQMARLFVTGEGH